MYYFETLFNDLKDACGEEKTRCQTICTKCCCKTKKKKGKKYDELVYKEMMGRINCLHSKNKQFSQTVISPDFKMCQQKKKSCNKFAGSTRMSYNPEIIVEGIVDSMWETMSPDITCRLIEFLVKECNMNDEEAEEFIYSNRLCESSNLHDITLSSKHQSKWVRQLSKALSTRTEQYFNSMVLSQSNPLVKEMTKEILKGVTNLTGQEISSKHPKTKMQQLSVLVATRLGIWIDELVADLDKPMHIAEETETGKLQEVEKEQIKEEEKLDEEGEKKIELEKEKEEDTEERVEAEEKKEDKTEEEGKLETVEEVKEDIEQTEEVKGEEKVDEASEEKEDEKEVQEEDKAKEEEENEERKSESEEVDQGEKEDTAEEGKEEVKEDTVEEGKEEEKEDITKEGEEEGTIETAEEGKEGEKEEATEEEKEEEIEKVTEAEDEKKEEMVEEEQEQKEPIEDEDKLEKEKEEDTDGKEEKVPEIDEEEVKIEVEEEKDEEGKDVSGEEKQETILEGAETEKPPEVETDEKQLVTESDSEKVHEESGIEPDEEKPAPVQSYSDILAVIKDDIAVTPKGGETERQKYIKDAINKRLDRIIGSDIDQIPTENIDDVASKVAHWIEEIMESVETPKKVVPPKAAPAFAIKQITGSTLEVHKLSSGNVAETTAQVRGIESPHKRKMPTSESPLNLKSTQEWLDWVTDIASVSLQWDEWIDGMLTDAERQVADKTKGSSEEHRNWKQWRDQARREAQKWKGETGRIKDEGKNWSKKF